MSFGCNDIDDYFSIVPPVYNHFSVETPTPCSSPPCLSGEIFADPSNPLLALREIPIPSRSPPPMASQILQRQTSAAHGTSLRRPHPRPVQNVLQVTSGSSSDSDSPKSSLDCTMSAPEFARCSRCQRTPSIDMQTGRINMIEYGLNLWYCNRCAGFVGLINR